MGDEAHLNFTSSVSKVFLLDSQSAHAISRKKHYMQRTMVHSRISGDCRNWFFRERRQDPLNVTLRKLLYRHWKRQMKRTHFFTRMKQHTIYTHILTYWSLVTVSMTCQLQLVGIPHVNGVLKWLRHNWWYAVASL